MTAVCYHPYCNWNMKSEYQFMKFLHYSGFYRKKIISYSLIMKTIGHILYFFYPCVIISLIQPRFFNFSNSSALLDTMQHLYPFSVPQENSCENGQRKI